MKIKSLAPWFGGKRTMAPRIVKELGPHDQYFEPFCGSAAVLLTKPQCKDETVNDLHGDLINLARVIQDPCQCPLLFARLHRTLFSEGLLDDARKLLRSGANFELDGSNDLERAYWYFVSSWMSRSGLAGQKRVNFQAAVRWTQGGGSPTIRFNSAVDSVPAWHERLKNVVILCRDSFEIIPRFDDSSTTAIYVDPPYPRGTRSGDHNYVWDFDAGDGLFADQHEVLAGLLKRFENARVVVSTYENELYRELYDGWTFVDCMTRKQLAAQNKRGTNSRAEAPEVLIVNGSSYVSATEDAVSAPAV